MNLTPSTSSQSMESDETRASNLERKLKEYIRIISPHFSQEADKQACSRWLASNPEFILATNKLHWARAACDSTKESKRGIKRALAKACKETDFTVPASVAKFVQTMVEGEARQKARDEFMRRQQERRTESSTSPPSERDSPLGRSKSRSLTSDSDGGLSPKSPLAKTTVLRFRGETTSSSSSGREFSPEASRKIPVGAATKKSNSEEENIYISFPRTSYLVKKSQKDFDEISLAVVSKLRHYKHVEEAISKYLAES